MKRIAAVILFTSFFYWTKYSNSKCEAVDVEWNKFGTNDYYANVKLITELEDFSALRFFSKEIPVLYSRMECARTCAANQSCHAFNFYPTVSFYVCELLPTNLCLTDVRKAFVDCPGCQLWEKLSTSMSQSCLTTQYPSLTNVPCEVMRPGCQGYWPNCSNCTKVCNDCFKRYSPQDVHNCTLWPNGDMDWPIFGTCWQFKTFLIKRQIDISTGHWITNYKMSFYDMNRVFQLQAYPLFEVHFITDTGTHNWAAYSSFYVDVNGTFSNLTFSSSSSSYPQYDVFKLNDNTQARFPFVNVTDDRYGCGSFWLLDPNNATYCPGGKTKLFGPVQMNSGVVISTGLSYPPFPDSAFVTYASMELA